MKKAFPEKKGSRNNNNLTSNKKSFKRSAEYFDNMRSSKKFMQRNNSEAIDGYIKDPVNLNFKITSSKLKRKTGPTSKTVEYLNHSGSCGSIAQVTFERASAVGLSTRPLV
jgi:hypothetical protein